MSLFLPPSGYDTVDFHDPPEKINATALAVLFRFAQNDLDDAAFHLPAGRLPKSRLAALASDLEKLCALIRHYAEGMED